MKTSVAVKVRSYRGSYTGAAAVISRMRKIQRIKFVVFSTFKLVAFLLLVYFMAVGGYEGYKYVITSPFFNISDITIDGNINLKRDDILSIGSVNIGQSIFAVDIEGIYKRLKRHPWIKDATVKKEIPDRLKIRINERKPAAILKSNGLYPVIKNAPPEFSNGVYLIDNDGVVLVKLNEEPEMSFPVIIKPIDMEFKVGDRVNSEEVFIGLNIWERLQEVKLSYGSPSPKDNITAIEPLNFYKVKAHLRDTNSYIVINDEDIVQKFQNLQTVMRLLEDKTDIDYEETVKDENNPLLKEEKKEEVREIDYIDLSFKDKVIVKYKNQ